MSDRGLALIWAMGKNRCIGRDGALPWHLPEDLRHFKRTTKGHAILMGRKTWQSIGKPLPGRRNIVISRQPGFQAEGVEVFASLEEAITAAQATDPLPFVIGGAQLYATALPQATHLFITEVDQAPEGDTFFPEFDPSPFAEVDRRAGETPGVTFSEWKRRG